MRHDTRSVVIDEQKYIVMQYTVELFSILCIRTTLLEEIIIIWIDAYEMLFFSELLTTVKIIHSFINYNVVSYILDYIE